MQKNRKSALKIALLSLFPLLAATPARADFHDEPFANRLTLTFDNLTAFTDVTARAGTTAAHPLGSSLNPASKDFLREAPFDYNVLDAATSNYIQFGSGAQVLGESNTTLVRFPHAGTLSVAYVRTDMLDGASRQGADYGFNSNEAIIAYGYRLAPTLSIGAEAHLTQSYLSIRSPVAFGPAQVTNDSAGGTGTLGILWAPEKHWTVGLLGGAGDSASETTVDVLIPGTPGARIQQNDQLYNYNLRAGFGYHPVEQLGLFVDWQYRNVQSKFTNATDLYRMYAGLEYAPKPWLVLRCGANVDSADRATLAAGVGFYAFKPFLFELAYAYNNFPEVENEFGRAHVIGFSAMVKF